MHFNIKLWSFNLDSIFCFISTFQFSLYSVSWQRESKDWLSPYLSESFIQLVLLTFFTSGLLFLRLLTIRKTTQTQACYCWHRISPFDGFKVFFNYFGSFLLLGGYNFRMIVKENQQMNTLLTSIKEPSCFMSFIVYFGVFTISRIGTLKFALLFYN